MTTAKARRTIEEAGCNWDDFLKWMGGQTIGMYPDGSTDWFDYDVGRYIRYGRDQIKQPVCERD